MIEKLLTENKKIWNVKQTRVVIEIVTRQGKEIKIVKLQI